MKDKPLLVLSHEFPPAGGGAGRNLALLCEELYRRNIPLEVWTTGLKEEDAGFPFRVRRLSKGRKHRFETNFPKMAQFLIRTLAQATLSSRPRAIFSNMALPAGLVGGLLASYWQVPHIIWHHGSDVHAGMPKGAGIIQRVLLRLVWRGSEHAFFVSESLMQMAAGYGEIPSASILPSFPDPRYAQTAARMKSEKTDSHGRKYFLFAGRFEPVKNPMLILEAAALWKSGGEELRPIRLVGQGSLSGELRKKVKDLGLEPFVSIEDPVSPEAMSDLFLGAYALLAPSRAEGLYTTILEAAAFGVPVIGSRTVGIQDAIESGITGAHFQENSPEELAKAMIRLSSDENVRKEMGEAAARKNTGLTPAQAADVFLASLDFLR